MSPNEITRRLCALTRQRGVQVLIAIESGSRAWGFASNDSDYDVRFLYCHPEPWYLSLAPRKDTIDLLDGDFDAGGWDLRKALRLLRGGNVPLHEWLGSPIVYFENRDVARQLRELAQDAFLPLSATHHYLSMARRKLDEINEGKKRTLKAAFYGLRAALCARDICERAAMPPVPIEPLAARWLTTAEQQHYKTWLAAKQAGTESTVIEDESRLIEVLIRLIEAAEARTPTAANKLAWSRFDDAFTAVLTSAKPAHG